MEDKKSLGSYITAKRKEKNLTQKAFAEKLFVTESAVSKWERGLSYPDISLIRKICEVLQISEREFLTATEDTETREIKKSAKKYRLLVNIYKYTLLISYGAAIITCFICNLAIDHTLSWFFVVLASVANAFSVTLLPLYLRKNKAATVLLAFTVTLLLLLLTCNIFSGGTWVIIVVPCIITGLSLMFLPFGLKAVVENTKLADKKTLVYIIVNTVLIILMLYVIFVYLGTPNIFFEIALPITLFSLAFIWATVLIIRYLKISIRYKAAICIAILCIPFNFINAFLEKIIPGVNQEGTLRLFNIKGFTYPDYIGGDINFIIMVCMVLTAIGLIIYEKMAKSKNR